MESAGLLSGDGHPRLLRVSVRPESVDDAGVLDHWEPIVAFLLTFALSGLTTYWLGVELTGRRYAGWVAGVAFAFAPYRMDQLAHIRVLASFWMPVVMLGLHRYYRDGHTWWLVLFAGATVTQGLKNGYYLLFFPVLVALWVLWCTPNEAGRERRARLG